VWWKNTGGTTPGTTGNGPWSWSRVFDIGSCGVTNLQTGVKITGPGGFQTNSGQLDFFYYTAHVGQGYGSVNQRQLGWQNKDVGPAGTTTNSANSTVNVQTMGSYQVDRHVVVSWKESTGRISAYENGLLVASITASNAMSALNDLNAWLGRSLNQADNGFAGEFDEMRIYNYVLSPGQVVGNFQVGPNTVNTATQTPVISAQPLNATANRGWPASFYIRASGSPGVSYQWSRNGSSIPGATTDTYSISAVSTANNGDTYSCTVSNFANSTPNTVVSSAATLTVTPNVAISASALHETRDADPTGTGNGIRNNFGGSVGGSFQVGAGGAVITHLGFYDLYGDGLAHSHGVGIFSGSTLIVATNVPAGIDPSTSLYHGYRYIALSTPLVLAPNTTYTLAGEVVNLDGDSWPDIFAPAIWSTNFVGTNTFSSRAGRFTSTAWPAAPNSGTTANSAYGAPNLATLPVGPAQVWALQTSVTQYVGIPVALSVLANGQAPMSVQWYKAPGTLLAGQTSPSLAFSNPALSDAGDYYAVVSNTLAVAQSPNITLTILGNTPVTIDQQPVDFTVAELFPASFTIAASGTPPIGYQWRRNGVNIAGATTNSYNIAAASPTNNGDVYFCVVSNRTTSANLATSANATLTVIPNQAPPSQILYQAVLGARDNFAGVVGALVTIGASPAVVTHLGFYSASGNLQSPHHVGIFPATGSTAPFASVFVNDPNPPVPQTTFYTNSYIWVALTNPVTLAANTSYILGAEVYASSGGDAWPDVFAPDSWNPYFVGANGASTRIARFSGGNWPVYPTSTSAQNSIYAAPNMAILAQGPPVVSMPRTNITQFVGSNVGIVSFVDGQVPLSVQWYKAPSSVLAGQTNSTLNLVNAALGDSGTYYVIANNGFGSTQGSNVTLSIISQGPPVITQQPASQVVYSNQTVFFNVVVSIAPTNYQWSFNGTPIAGATASTLSLPSTTDAFNGNYQVIVANSFGSTTSAVATLTVLNPTPGSYLASILGASPLVYYRFSDVTNGGASYNFGSMGVAEAGAYEGSFLSAAGPQPPAFPNFETDNVSLALDGGTVDVAIPPLNLGGGPNVTFAAWINANGVQSQNAGILFSRSSVASGLGIKHDTSNPGVDMLEYHWNSLYFQSNSLLDLPVNQWVFTALTIAPNQAIIYLQDGTGMKTWTNNSTHAAVAFDGNLYVGRDNIDLTTRRFNGSIDEPMIFGRTLSPTEINKIYQAAVTVGAVRLQITPSGGNVVLTWPSGTLQQAPAVAGTYTNVPSATSPYTVTPNGAAFYRVLVQ
jgi:hypothetical protein